MKTALLVVDAYLVGLAVVVALVVYPAFRYVGSAEWATYHRRHTTAIGFAVAPAWFAQGVMSALWIISGPQRPLALLHGVCAALGVIVTVVGAVPQHNALSLAQSASRQRRLETWHWVRTMLWVGAVLIAAFA